MSNENIRYTKEHEWIRIEGEVAVIGITDHAQNALGDITYVELPEPGREVKISEAIAVLESVKAASDVYSPVSGMIQEVNHLLEESPEKINTSPYKDGWICKIDILDSPDLEGLMDREGYERFLESEDDK